MAEAAPTPASPRVIAGYEILEKVGQGGMGAVFRAKQISMNRVVALKLLPRKLAQDPKFKERFFREARLSAKLNHLNIVNAISCGEEDGYTYLAMEFVEGQTVKKQLEKNGPFSINAGLTLLRELADALVCAESHHLIHRDIKPDNVMLDRDGRAKLCDLGLARSTEDEDSTITITGQAVGTPHYMSPEQARGRDNVDIRTDIYSLGATAYHIFSGRTLFSGPTSAVIMALHLSETAPPLNEVRPEVSEGLAAVVSKMLAKDPQERYATPAELLADLDALRDERAPKALSFHGKSSCAPPPKTSKNRRAEKEGRTTGPRAPLNAPTTGPNAAVTRRAETSKAPQKKSAAPLLIGAGLAVVALGALAFFALRNPEAPKSAEKTEEPKPETKPSPAPRIEKSVRDTPKSSVEPPAPPKIAPAETKLPDPLPVKEEPKPEPAPVKPEPAAPVVPAAAAPTLDAAGLDACLDRILAALAARDRKQTDLELKQLAEERLAPELQPVAAAIADAVKQIYAQFAARTDALEKLVGQDVHLKTAKEALNGKLKSAANGTLRVEKQFMINGAPTGSTTLTAAYTDLLPESWDQIYPPPAPAAPAGFAAPILLHLSEKRVVLAATELDQYKGQPLETFFKRQLDKVQTEAREAKAAETWDKLKVRSQGNPTQDQAKQLLKDIDAFEKDFGTTAFATTGLPARTDLKEELGKIAAGWDRQIGALFKGKIVAFDRKTLDLKLDYDFSDTAQMDDFPGSNWGKHGGYGCVLMEKGSLKVFNDQTYNKDVNIPAYLSGEVTFAFTYKEFHNSWGSYRVALWLSLPGATGKAPKLVVQFDKGTVSLLDEGGKEYKKDDCPVLPKNGKIEISSHGKVIAVQLDGKKIFEYTLDKPLDAHGLTFGGGGDSGMSVTRFEISGKLDPQWVATALKAQEANKAQPAK